MGKSVSMLTNFHHIAKGTTLHDMAEQLKDASDEIVRLLELKWKASKMSSDLLHGWTGMGIGEREEQCEALARDINRMVTDLEIARQEYEVCRTLFMSAAEIEANR